MRSYVLADAQLAASYAKHSDNEAIYSLRDEIALIRTLMTDKLRQLDNDLEIQLATPIIINLAQTLERLVKTSSQVEVKLGAMLSKETVVLLAQGIMQVLASEIQHIPGYEAIIDKIHQRILTEVRITKNTEESE